MTDIEKCLRDLVIAQDNLSRAEKELLRSEYLLGQALVRKRMEIEQSVKDKEIYIVQGIQHPHVMTAYGIVGETKREWEIFLRIQGIDPLTARRAIKTYEKYRSTFIEDEKSTTLVDKELKDKEEKL